MYAIVRTGGKQYRVEEGRTIQVERLPNEEGSNVELDDVLLIADNGEVTVGSPSIDGARVLAEVDSHIRAKKIVVFKYRAKVRTRKKTGHRQHLTRLAVTEILRPGQESKAAKPKRRRSTKKEEAPEEATAEATVTAAENKPAPKRTRKPAPATAKAATSTERTTDEQPKRRTRKAAPKAEAKTPTKDVTDEKPAPKRTRKPAASKASAKGETAEKKPARKRTPRAKAPEKKDEE